MFIDNEVIKIDKNGIWLSNGEPITHEKTLQAYNRFLGRDKQGYFVEIGNNFKRIEVEDTAYFVTLVEHLDEDKIKIRLNDGCTELLDPETLTYRPERLTCLVKNKTEEAKFLSQAYYDLLKEIEEDLGEFFITISGKKIRLS